MPEGVDEYSDTKNAPEYVEKKKCRMVRELNAAFPLDHVGKQYDGNPEATKREQSESLHIATRQVGELIFLWFRVTAWFAVYRAGRGVVLMLQVLSSAAVMAGPVLIAFSGYHAPVQDIPRTAVDRRGSVR
jgi:hypothetical protein